MPSSSWRLRGLIALLAITPFLYGLPTRADDVRPAGLRYLKGHLGSPGSLNVPLLVDRTVRRLMISVWADKLGAATLRSPSGAVARHNGDDVAFIVGPSSHLMSIQHPEPGEWTLEITGSGAFDVSARGYSPVQFAHFTFLRTSSGVEVTDVPIYGEPFAYPGAPDSSAEAFLEGELSSTAFTLEAESGEVVGALAARREPGNPAKARFFVTGALPSVPFHVVATGTLAAPKGADDAKGMAYRRVFPAVYTTRAVQIE